MKPPNMIPFIVRFARRITHNNCEIGPFGARRQVTEIFESAKGANKLAKGDRCFAAAIDSQGWHSMIVQVCPLGRYGRPASRLTLSSRQLRFS